MPQSDALQTGQLARFSPRSLLALIQGLYYLVTGIWPLVSVRSFQKVTGPKIDLWLVKTFGAFIAVVGGALTLAGLRNQPDAPEVPLLGSASAAALGGADILYSSKGRISKVYLAEGMVELLLVTAWTWLLVRSAQKSSVR